MQDLTKNLTKKWRGHANTFQRFNEQGIATAFSTCADELEAAVSVRGDELLTLEEAEQKSGYTADSLGRLIRQGKIPNAGKTGTPKISRRNLPRKPGLRNGNRQAYGVDLVEQIVASVVDSQKGGLDG